MDCLFGGAGIFVLGGCVIDALIYVVPDGMRESSNAVEPFIEEPLKMFGVVVMSEGLAEKMDLMAGKTEGVVKC